MLLTKAGHAAYDVDVRIHVDVVAKKGRIS